MSDQDIDARLSRQPIERYQWPLAAGLILLSASMLIGERRRMRAVKPVLALFCLFACVPGAAAKNSGVEAYERQDYSGALDQFSKQLQRQPRSPALHFNLGDAAYQQGDIDKALAAFSKALTSPNPQIRGKAEYNLGNTLFQRGAVQKEREPKVQDWRNALQHYEQALKVEPKNADAAYNAEVVRKLLEEAEKEPPKSDQQKDDQKQDNKNQNKDDQQQQPSGGKGDQDQQDRQQSGDKKGEDKEQQDKGKPGDQDKKKDKGDKSDDQKQGEKDKDKGDNKKDGQEGEQPEQTPNPGEKKEGDLKNAPQFGEEKDGQDEDQQAAEARAAAEGKMTEAQARSLLDSLKAEDDRVQLLNPKDRKARGRVLRDW